ncbi:hypothetical protein EKK58_05635 [Candidatus Dependentiae bacterium]|nr:MAG: hypothetical protein EKK58_05635 [Candidatus Dependentiae bacterium]
MRSEPYQFEVSAGDTSSNELTVKDFIDKTFEVANLESGSVVIEGLVAVKWNEILTISSDGVYSITEQLSKVRIKATDAVGANLEVHMLALNTRAE